MSPISSVTASQALWQLTAPVIAGRPEMRVASPRGTGIQYHADDQKPLTDYRPGLPAAVMLYDDAARLHCLALDFDAKTPTHADLAQRHALEALDLLRLCGFAAWADYSPAGGWHVYAPLAAPIGLPAVKALATSLKSRYSTLDISPLVNRAGGCIRPTGSVHAAGGTQQLHSLTITELRELLEKPRSRQSWTALTELIPPTAPEIVTEPLATAQVFDLRQNRLPQKWEQLATTGSGIDNYPSASEARMAIAGAAAWAGWTASEYLRAIHTRWTWLRGSYERKQRNLAGPAGRDFAKAQSNAAEYKTVRRSDTSHELTRGAHPQYREESSNVQIRRWLSFATTYGRTCSKGAYSPSKQAVVRTLAAFGLMLDSRVINVGVRSIALGAGMGHSNVAKILHELSEDGLIWRSREARGVQADSWVLHTDQAVSSPIWRGKIHGTLAVFRLLGGFQCAEVYEELVSLRQTPISASKLATRINRSRSTVTKALADLAAYELAENTDTGWVMGTAEVQAVADELGATELEVIQRTRYAEQRALWREYLATLPSTRELEAAQDHYDGSDYDRLEEIELALGLDPPWLELLTDHLGGQVLPDTG